MTDKELFERATRIAEQTIQDVFPSMDAALAVRYIEQLRDRIAAALREREQPGTINTAAVCMDCGSRNVTFYIANIAPEPSTQPTPEPKAYCGIHGDFYSGYAECPTCKLMRRESQPSTCSKCGHPLATGCTDDGKPEGCTEDMCQFVESQPESGQ